MAGRRTGHSWHGRLNSRWKAEALALRMPALSRSLPRGLAVPGEDNLQTSYCRRFGQPVICMVTLQRARNQQDLRDHAMQWVKGNWSSTALKRDYLMTSISRSESARFLV